VNGRAPQWALDVLRSRGHGAAEDANGDELTLTDPVWANATCFRAKKWVSWEFGSSVSVPSSRLKCINFADKNPVVLHGWVVQSATIEENDDDGPPHTFMALIIDDPACPSSAPKPTPFMEEIQIPSTWLGHHVAIRGILDDGEYLGIDIKSIADIK
jgi:hypothetical protein